RGSGRPHPPAAQAPVPVQAAAVAPPPPARRIAVVSYDLWLTYLPDGLRRVRGGALEPGQGAWARFASEDRFVEVRVERGARTLPRDPRRIILRGRPALVGRAQGGLAIAWLERPGTGVWIRVGGNLSEELLRVAASVKGPVGD
ncbi:hypothetical protein, partial [Nonomuraea rhizosphaerae]|uniref:hypothetical protein n=1 Tax=Nonomuraea rhizosphaerae TaxID=2665663 RepID=UPI001C5E01C2